MEQIPNRYPGIVKVEYFDLSSLPVRPDMIVKNEMVLNLPEERFVIPLIEPGTCDVNFVYGFESLTLKFSSSKKISPNFRPAFIFYDANDRIFLVGSGSKPFPKVKISRSFGSVPDQRPEFAYEITHIAVNTPIEI